MLVDNPEQFLHDSGLLFHINRNILHPLGLAMSLATEEFEGTDMVSVIIHETEDSLGFTFNDIHEIAQCKTALQQFLATRKHRVLTRASTLGYIVQPVED